MKLQRVMALYLNKSFNRIKLDLIQNLIGVLGIFPSKKT